MSTQDAGIRQDLIENGVERELLSIQENVGSPQELGSALQSELEHDLIVWPREYLETYLDRGNDGTIPLNEVQLQDLLEAAFDRDEELARDALAALKRAMSKDESATLTVSLDDEASDRTASPVMVTGTPGIDGEEPQFLVSIQNDTRHNGLHELLEKTAGVVEKRALLGALSNPSATYSYASKWSTEKRTSDLSVFLDVKGQPTVANEPDHTTASRPAVFHLLRARLRRLLHAGRGESGNSQQALARVDPEFRQENSRYVAEYEADGPTVRLHDKRSVEDERAVGPAFDARSVESADTIRTATEKDLQQKAAKDRASLATAVSQLSDSLQGAAGQTELVQQHRQVALTDSGVYSGKIVFETPELLIQRISAATEVAHPKSLLAEIPQMGQLVRIAYHNNVARVRELQERKPEKELAR